MSVGLSVAHTFEFPLPMNISVQQSSLMTPTPLTYIVVGYMVADMVADMEVHMVADMEVDKVADIVADIVADN